jgi:carbonic anhydrase
MLIIKGLTMLKQKLPVLVGLCIALTGSYVFAANDAGVKVKWSYHGTESPAHWGQLSPAFKLCGNGKTQSPIDIADVKEETKNALTIHYQSDPLVILENGETTLIIDGTQTITNTGHGLQVSFPTDYEKEVMTFEGKDYQLVQFHMHTPSENKLDGKAFPLEIHFVHQGADGTVAVIGVFVKIGEENPALQKIITHIPKKIGVPKTIEGQKIDPKDLIPDAQAYYKFMGSLTTPPCSEGLQWIVIKEAITASPEQIAKIKAAGETDNARPLQPLNNRSIAYAAQ